MMVRAGRRIVSGAMALFLVAGATAVLAGVTAAPAGAAPQSHTYTYECKVFGNTLPLPVTFAATVPVGVDPGHTTKLTGFQATVTITATLVTAFIGVLHAKSVSGTVTTLDVKATTASPGTINVAATPIDIGPVTPVAKQPLAITIPASPVTVGPWTAGSGGTIAITPATVKVNAVIRTTSTKTTAISLPCSPKPTPQPLGSIPVQYPAVTSGALPAAEVGSAYTTSLPVVGGTAPYTWSITAGTLPAGLSLSPTGLVSGTPTKTGTSKFSVKVVDANGHSATGTLSITVSAFGAPGYQLVASDGGVFSYGAAHFYGSMGGRPLNAPIVASAFSPNSRGYWEVASDGGIFSFGDAKFHGSMGGRPLNRPIVGMAATPDGQGYWEVASDGGIFAFGDAHFYGSMGGKPLNQPIVGLAVTPDGMGYWEVAADGGLFAFGDAHFFGSMGGKPLNKPIVGMAAAYGGQGYWEVAADGGLFAFGDAHFFGSMGGKPLNKPVVAVAGAAFR